MKGWRELLIESCRAEQTALAQTDPAKRDACMERARAYLDEAIKTPRERK